MNEISSWTLRTEAAMVIVGDSCHNPEEEENAPTTDNSSSKSYVNDTSGDPYRGEESVRFSQFQSYF